MDDGILCQGSIWFYFTHTSCASCLWFDKAELFNFNGVRWTKTSVGIWLRLPLPNEAFAARFGATSACRSSQASCSQLWHILFGFGERRNVAVVPRLPVDLVLEQSAQRWKNHLLTCCLRCELDVPEKSKFPPPYPHNKTWNVSKVSHGKEGKSFSFDHISSLIVSSGSVAIYFSAAAAALSSRMSRHTVWFRHMFSKVSSFDVRFWKPSPVDSARLRVHAASPGLVHPCVRCARRRSVGAACMLIEVKGSLL